MKTSLLSLFAGTVFLAGGAIASAGEPVTLASAELDAVTAGAYDNTTATISQSIRQTNRARVNVRQSASSSGSYSPAYNTSAVTLTQSNAASQTNSGNATASHQ